jgi:hypothetical protein
MSERIEKSLPLCSPVKVLYTGDLLEQFSEPIHSTHTAKMTPRFIHLKRLEQNVAQTENCHVTRTEKKFGSATRGYTSKQTTNLPRNIALTIFVLSRDSNIFISYTLSMHAFYSWLQKRCPGRTFARHIHSMGMG